MERIISLVIGYAFGLIQTSYIIGRIKGIDIRTKGSGNAGTTNTLRVLGLKAGIITLAVDILKCIAAAVVVRAIYRSTGLAVLYGVYACAGTVLGHDFPFYLGFKGGKGVAASAGMILAFGDWILVPIAAACFFIPAIATRFVSLGSLCLESGFFVSVLVSCLLGRYPLPTGACVEMCVIFGLLTLLNFVQHRANIRRLATGTENKFSIHRS